MGYFDHCPSEVLELVFSHLTKEILECTLISPRISKIISSSVQLMKDCRFKTQGYHYSLGVRKSSLATRKYSQVDFNDLDMKSIFRDAPSFITQVAFEKCRMNTDAFHALLAEISNTLEVLIVSSCKFYKNDIEKMLKWNKEEILKFSPVEFPKLKTLILAELFGRSRFFALSIIKASNLTELGLINMIDELENCVAKLYVDLIKSNRQIKNLHIPKNATEKFIADTLEHPEVKYELEELSLAYGGYLNNFMPDDFLDIVMNFLETQRTTLKCLRLANYELVERHVRRLLWLDFVRLELFSCSLEFSLGTAIANKTIESLAVIDPENSASFVELCRFISKCKNLSALTVFTEPPSGDVIPESAKKSIIDVKKLLPKHIPWSDFRRVRYAGTAFTIAVVCCYAKGLLFNDESKNVTVDQHPYSIMRFEKRSLAVEFMYTARLKVHYMPRWLSIIFIICFILLAFTATFILSLFNNAEEFRTQCSNDTTLICNVISFVHSLKYSN